MNAVPDSHFPEDAENGVGSNSDANSDDSPEYYQPISTGEDVSDSDDFDSHRLPNGYPNGAVNGVVNGVSLSDDDDDEEMKRREEEREREEAAARRAMREDERRRNAPLGAENASRVLEAMRGVTFGGMVPVWAGRVPEQEWIGRIRRSTEEARETTIRD